MKKIILVLGILCLGLPAVCGKPKDVGTLSDRFEGLTLRSRTRTALNVLRESQFEETMHSNSSAPSCSRRAPHSLAPRKSLSKRKGRSKKSLRNPPALSPLTRPINAPIPCFVALQVAGQPILPPAGHVIHIQPLIFPSPFSL